STQAEVKARAFWFRRVRGTRGLRLRFVAASDHDGSDAGAGSTYCPPCLRFARRSLAGEPFSPPNGEVSPAALNIINPLKTSKAGGYGERQQGGVLGHLKSWTAKFVMMRSVVRL